MSLTVHHQELHAYFTALMAAEKTVSRACTVGEYMLVSFPWSPTLECGRAWEHLWMCSLGPRPEQPPVQTTFSIACRPGSDICTRWGLETRPSQMRSGNQTLAERPGNQTITDEIWKPHPRRWGLGTRPSQMRPGNQTITDEAWEPDPRRWGLGVRLVKVMAGYC